MLWTAAVLVALGPQATRASAATAPATLPGVEALEYGFRFASAIATDPKDRGKAQLAVVQDLAQVGARQDAARLAATIGDWRRGIAYADLARAAADVGDIAAARDLIGLAEQAQRVAKDWHGPRIASQVALARAELGDLAAATEIAQSVAKNDRRQYQGQSAGTVATAHAARGEFEPAMAALRVLDAETDLDVSWSRTQGYLGVARATALTADQRRQALTAARRSADGVPGWKKIDALESVARESTALGDRQGAVDALTVADEYARSLADSASKSPLLTTVARAWARAGVRDRARALLADAESLTGRAMAIEQPEIYAYLASGYVLLDDTGEAQRVFDLALERAEALANSRPRALAVVAICRSLGQHGVALDPARRERLDRLLAGLGDPW